MNLDITDRTRRYGYIFWKKNKDEDIKKLIGEVDKIDVVYNGKYLGSKRVDWKNRRISIGRAHTGTISDKQSQFRLSKDQPDRLQIKPV